ncbi:MAG: BolA/IbaG family iron-sulfur metabolism protein [Hahellaceae bacterium]|nr:BolA/IbaG family iron-sulfur metabolism protein [Hahellaceae bacterium]MCP5169048.1 BolA/IbaG family iron-sulfur metabolism protein [Hahellaceae bacterium]
MQAHEIESIISERLEGSEVHAQSDGRHAQAVVICEQFAGLSPVKRQQMVYACVNEYLLNDTLHALSLKTYTPEQWKALNS